MNLNVSRSEMSVQSVLPKPSLTLSLLETYFSTIKDMHTYLSEILQSEASDSRDDFPFTPNDSDSPAYHSLVNASYVALTPAQSAEQENNPVRYKCFPPMLYMQDLIDKAQERLFSRANGRARNIITAGYRLASKNGECGKYGMERMGITNFFVNTIVTALQAPEWDCLLQRIGTDAMLHILTDTSVFVSLPNECLCQLTGEQLMYLPKRPSVGPLRVSEFHIVHRLIPDRKRPALGPHDDERPKKRPRLCDSGLSGGTSALPTPEILHRSPADIALVRARLFYGRPARVPYTNHIVVGLPPKHILNVLNPSYSKPPKIKPEDYVEPNPRKQAENARHLSKYVFPRQYGLSSPFIMEGKMKRETFKIPDYADRETAIKAMGPCKTPKRLKEILAILEKMIWRHGKCGYKPLRDKACPSKTRENESKHLDSSVILELMSEQSSHPRSQASMANISVDSIGWPNAARVLSQPEKDVKHKPQFAEFACSYVEVYRYAALVTKTVIPKAFWGCKKNYQLVLRLVKDFIVSRRYETLTLHSILQGFSTSECEWLMPPGRAAQRQTRVCVSDALKRRELLEEFLFWYFDSFLLPLLKTTFYVTESSAFRNKILYFRQDDWEALCAPLIDRLTSNTFEKMPAFEAEEILRQRKLGFAFVRLLPKDTGVRPIVNLRRKKTSRKGTFGPPEPSINQVLQAAFQILTYEKNAHPKLLGASVFGRNEVYHKLKAYKSRLPRDSSGNLTKLYFVKVDVQACFDTIEQSKLLEILRHLISEDVYMVQRYGQVRPVAGKAKSIFVKKAIPEVCHRADDHPHFLTYAAQLAETLRHTVLVDQVMYPSAKKQEILQLLEEHITENIVKIGQDYYRQMVGIPQGSVISTLLCSFFYGDLEQRFFRYTEDPESLLLRLVDDYLLITTSLSKATSFLDMMQKGHPEYGCFISKAKTLTNFDYDTEIMNVTEPQQRHFQWCGFLIDMQDLSISTDYSRYLGTSLTNSLTVNKGRQPHAAFVSKMLQLAKAKSHDIYCDAEFNKEYVVYQNIYQNFVLSAMKMHGYIRTWGIDVTKSTKFIHNTIRQMIRYTFATIRTKASQKVGKTKKCDIQRAAVTWLGTQAFYDILCRKKTIYSSLVKLLGFELSLPQHRRSRRRFRNLVQESLVTMIHISF